MHRFKWMPEFRSVNGSVADVDQATDLNTPSAFHIPHSRSSHHCQCRAARNMVGRGHIVTIERTLANTEHDKCGTGRQNGGSTLPGIWTHEKFSRQMWWNE